MRIVIADDEPLARERLRLLLADQPDAEVVAEAGDGHAALLRDWGFKVDWHDYPMAHQVCGEEIDALAAWLGSRLG